MLTAGVVGGVAWLTGTAPLVVAATATLVLAGQALALRLREAELAPPGGRR
ncbi:MAG: hypothetical protein H0V40_12565 [Actinobacteria bacterium]|nr:hypothetical protein [Actinomycetota bacterium]